jgi:hypothetical protein
MSTDVSQVHAASIIRAMIIAQYIQEDSELKTEWIPSAYLLIYKYYYSIPFTNAVAILKMFCY